MKKSIMLSLILLIALTAVSANSKPDQTLTIGISKIVAHPALDALEKGIQEVVLDKYPEAQFDLQNANGEVSTAASIAQKFKTSKVDLAVGIATPTAQALVQNLVDVPVVFSAVTDPVGAGLVTSLESGEGNVTGISDMIPVFDQIKMLKDVVGIKTLGHVYSSGEANAVVLAEMAKEACEELGIEFIGTTVTNSAEVKQATQAIVDRSDALYVTTDNTVVSALAALLDVAEQKGVPVFTADPTSVSEGEILISWGFDYYKMGRASGRLVLEILDGADPADLPVRFMTDAQDIDLYINLDVAEKLGISIPSNLQKDAATLIKDGKNINS